MSNSLLKFLFFLLFEAAGAWNGMISVSRWKDYLKTRNNFPLFFFFWHIINAFVCAAGAIWILFGVSFA